MRLHSTAPAPPPPQPTAHRDDDETTTTTHRDDDDDAVYELRVINSCVANDDVVLPRRPQVALLAPFYQYAWRASMDTIVCTSAARKGQDAQGKTREGKASSRPALRRGEGLGRRRRRRRVAVQDDRNSNHMTCAASASANRCTSTMREQWQLRTARTATQWLEHTPHIILGRHTTLPPNYRLQHDCVSRLHARIVYISHRAAHTYFTHTYPVVPAHRRNESNSTNSCCSSSNSKAHAAIEHTIEDDNSNNNEGDDDNNNIESSFVRPYYLLINHGENMTYVNTQGIPQGRSYVLCEGDVVSVLECAYDADGGILDVCPGPSDAAHTSSAIDTQEQKNNNQAEDDHGKVIHELGAQVDENNNNSNNNDNDVMMWCTQHALRPERFSQLQTQVQATLTAVTHGHGTPCVEDVRQTCEGVKSEDEEEEEKEEGRADDKNKDISAQGMTETSLTSSSTIEIHGHVIARRRALEVHPSLRQYLEHYTLHNRARNARLGSVQGVSNDEDAEQWQRVLQQLMINAAEEEKAEDAEEEEENAEDGEIDGGEVVLSPLNGLLRLDIRAVRHALLVLQQQQQQLERSSRREQQAEHTPVLRRRSVSVIDVDALDEEEEEEEEEEEKNSSTHMSDVMESSPLKQLIAELQLNATDDANEDEEEKERVRKHNEHTTTLAAEKAYMKEEEEATKCASTCTSLRTPSQHEESEGGSDSLEHIPTACDFVRLQPARVPVYVFTRQSRNSPARYTCERRTMRPLHHTEDGNSDEQQQQQQQPSYIYYYYEDKENNNDSTTEEAKSEAGGWTILRPKGKGLAAATTTTHASVGEGDDDGVVVVMRGHTRGRGRCGGQSTTAALTSSSSCSFFQTYSSIIPRGTVVAETASYKRERNVNPIPNNSNTTTASVLHPAAGTTAAMGPAMVEERSAGDEKGWAGHEETTSKAWEALVWIDETSAGARGRQGNALHKRRGRPRRRRHRY